MDGRSFDALAREVARAGRSRRQVIGRLAGGAVTGALGTIWGRGAVAKDGNDKGGKGGNGNKGGAGDKEPACRGVGHPCEGNQVCCEGLVCTRAGQGAALRCAAPAASNECESCGAAPVAAAPSYQVQVSCTFNQAADRTTCTCRGIAEGNGAPVQRVTVSPAEICVEVVGGGYTYVPPESGARAAGYASPGQGGVLTLILAGKVTTGGSATYWCTTAAGVFPAPGPGLVRVPEETAAGTGSIVVQAAQCAIAGAPSGGFDWYGRCTRPASGAVFALALWTGTGFEARGSATTGADGRLRFGQLQPGTYRLTQANAVWCHAESNSVDAQGGVIVNADQQATVWIFDCTGAAPATPAAK